MSRKHSPKFARFALFYTHYVHAGVCLHPKVLMRVNRLVYNASGPRNGA